MELDLKHLAAYLSHGVKFISTMDNPDDFTQINKTWTLDGVNKLFGNYHLLTKENSDAYDIRTCKLGLRPLSDFASYFCGLFDECIETRTFLNEGFITIENQFEDLYDMLYNYKIEWWPHGVIQLAYKHHFDIEGLIEQGLAVDINDLPN